MQPRQGICSSWQISKKGWHFTLKGKDSATFEHQQHPREDKGWGSWPVENTKAGEMRKKCLHVLSVSIPALEVAQKKGKLLMNLEIENFVDTYHLVILP